MRQPRIMLLGLTVAGFCAGLFGASNVAARRIAMQRSAIEARQAMIEAEDAGLRRENALLNAMLGVCGLQVQFGPQRTRSTALPISPARPARRSTV